MSDAAVAALRAHAAKRSASKKPRVRPFGTPPHPLFDLDVLPESAFLTSEEVAAVLRVSKTTPQSWRKIKDHPLQWEYVGGKPLCRVRYLRALIALGRADDG